MPSGRNQLPFACRPWRHHMHIPDHSHIHMKRTCLALLYARLLVLRHTSRQCTSVSPCP